MFLLVSVIQSTGESLFKGSLISGSLSTETIPPYSKEQAVRIYWNAFLFCNENTNSFLERRFSSN